MKIKSYQVGGIVYTPFVPNQTGSQGTASSSSKSSDSDEDGKLTGITKEIVEILQSNGLPSDVEKFLNKANSFLSSSTSLSGMSLFGGTNDDYDLTDLIKIQKLANDVKWNKERFDKATSNLDSEDAWGEVAMDSRGYMYVQDTEGNIKTVSASEYSENFDKGKYIAITNGQLLAIREMTGSPLAMNSEVLNNVSGTIGIKSVQEYILGLVEKLGTTTEQGYGSKKQNEIINGIEQLMAAGPDGFYKITNTQQGKDIKTALTYLYSQLSEPMKRTLRTTIAYNGGDPSKDLIKFIGSILTENVDSTQSVDFDTTTTKHHLQQTGQDQSSEGSVTINDAIRLGTGHDLGVPQRLQIVTKNGGMAFSIFAQSAGKVKDTSGNPLPSTNIEQLLVKAEAIGGLSLGSISFGDQLLHESDYNKVMFNANKNMYRVEMPYKEVASGKFVPNFELHAKLNRVQDRLKGQPKIKQNILSALKAEGISESEVRIDEQGNVRAINTMPFLVLGGIAGSGTLSFNEESPYVHNLSREEGNAYKSSYNNIILSGDPYSDKDITGNSTTWSGSNLYEGNIFIAIDPSIAAHVGGTTKAPVSAITNVTQQNMQHSGMITNF